MRNNLIRLRKEAGLSQEELADKLAVSRQAVSKWERGEALPDTDNLIRLAKLYNVSIDEIVGYTPDKSNFADNEESGNKEESADKRNSADKSNSADGANETNDTNDSGGTDGANGTDDSGDTNGSGGSDGTNDSGSSGDEFFTQNGRKDFYTKDGKRIRFESDGHRKSIFITDDDDDDDTDGGDYPRKKTGIRDVLESVYIILCIAAFFVWGAVFNGWEIAWTLFITVPIFTSIISCVRKRRVGKFNFPCFVTFVYLLFGMIFDIWHPLWIIFLLIPAFYPIARVIDSHIKYGNNDKK